MNIRDVLRFTSPCSGATDALIERDVEATMTALVWTNFQHARFSGAVESGPVKVVKPVVEFADHGRHGGHPVCFTFEQPLDPIHDVCVHDERAENGVFEGLNITTRYFVRRFPPSRESHFTM